MIGKDINFNNSTNQYINQPTTIPQAPLAVLENLGIE
jgi:hypothetical protein